MQKAGIPVTIDPFYATKQIYGQLYAALAKQAATGTFIGPQVSFWLDLLLFCAYHELHDKHKGQPGVIDSCHDIVMTYVILRDPITCWRSSHWIDDMSSSTAGLSCIRYLHCRDQSIS